MLAQIQNALAEVSARVKRQGYKGYDPGDGLTSWLRRLAFGNFFAERVLQQFIWKSPWNIRPLVGVKPLDSTKGRGFMAWGNLLRYKETGDPKFRDQAIACLDWLMKNKSPKAVEYCWGNQFDFVTRAGRIPAQEPTIVWSGLIGQAFLEGYELLDEQKYLNVAASICKWILHLPWEHTADGICLSYHGFSQSSIHNSNLIGAALLARTWRHTEHDRFLEVAQKAVSYSCHYQMADGAWWYGEEPKYHWIDNFHTGYNLDSLKCYIESTDDNSFKPNLRKGYHYFTQTFIEPSGRPRYYHNQSYPIDIQCAAQAIDTLCRFSDEYPKALMLAEKIAEWTFAHLWNSKGYFYYRKYPLVTSRTPYFHWGQATMFKALAHLSLKMIESARAWSSDNLRQVA